MCCKQTRCLLRAWPVTGIKRQNIEITNSNFERNVLCTHKQLRFWKCSPQSRSRYEWRQCHWSELVPRHNILYLVTDQLLCREQRRSLSENTVLDDWRSIKWEMEIITTCFLQHPIFRVINNKFAFLSPQSWHLALMDSQWYILWLKSFYPMRAMQHEVTMANHY